MPKGKYFLTGGLAGPWRKTRLEDGSEVIANPVLSGTESDLEGLEVNGIKYKVPGGGSDNIVYLSGTLAGESVVLTETRQELCDLLDSNKTVYLTFSMEDTDYKIYSVLLVAFYNIDKQHDTCMIEAGYGDVLFSSEGALDEAATFTQMS